MLKNLLVALIASAFTVGAYAQAQKAEPKGQSGTTTQPATPPSTKSDTSAAAKKDGATAEGTKKAKPKRKAKSKSTKASSTDAKDSRKDAATKDAATKDAKKDSK
jgi:hypothetical protein